MAKNAWLNELFDKEYGSGKLELVEVKELTQENLASAMKGSSNIAICYMRTIGLTKIQAVPAW